MAEKRMLVTDVDGTLLEEGKPTPGLDTLGTLLSVAPGEVKVVYATGRSFGSTRRLIDEGILPPADAVAAFVGTEVWFPPFDAPDDEFERLLSRDWDREAVAHVAGGFEELRPQSDDVQTAWKVSYYLNDRTILHRLRHALTTHELKARLIWSSGKHLDLLPRSAGKRRAIEFIRKRWEVDRDQVLVSGDSGNDIDMLADPGYRGVAVGNAEEELEVLEDEDTFHQASLPHAAGVLEGTEEFDFWDADAGARGKKEEGD